MNVMGLEPTHGIQWAGHATVAHNNLSCMYVCILYERERRQNGAKTLGSRNIIPIHAFVGFISSFVKRQDLICDTFGIGEKGVCGYE